MAAPDFALMRSFADVSRIQARERPDKPAFLFEGRTTSFAAFDRHASQAANGLVALGVKPQTHIAYLGKNCDYYFELLVAAAKANVIMTPVNWRLAGPEIVYILNDAKAQVLFVGPEFVDLARALLPELAHVRQVIAVEGGAPEWPSYEAWREGQSATDPDLPSTYDDVAIQLYTSGTTGRPKGAMLMNRGFFALREQHQAQGGSWQSWSDEDVSLVAMPCFHIGGTGWGVSGLIYGATGVVMREFDPTKVLDYFVTYGVSKLFLVPAAMQIVLRQANARDVDYSRLRNMLYGASPIPLDLMREAIEVFACGFVQMYGMTETTGTIVALPPEDHDPDGTPKMRSAGKALPGIEIQIIDEKGLELPHGEVGEIATRSAMNMKGYWNMPEATAATLSVDGWLRTGDAGFMDADGYVYIHDRVKDMIISGGENIYPAEVENALYSHPAVADVAVIGVPHEKWGEAVKAMVVLKPDASATEEELIGFARTRIAAYKCPKSVDFIAALPRNPSGKILRRELRAPFWAGQERQVN
jgi:acyl-CoA synthetase (AMP-forming)/AMP-acid ligase II